MGVGERKRRRRKRCGRGRLEGKGRAVGSSRSPAGRTKSTAKAWGKKKGAEKRGGGSRAGLRVAGARANHRPQRIGWAARGRRTRREHARQGW
eukprot:5890917-Prymnesium_polylepis.1